MNIQPNVVLLVVGAIMLVLAVKDLVVHRSLTSAGKTRLLVALIFAAVLAWNQLHQP
ncbi:MAG: hypothetical protein HY019_00675 [Aquabacterium sp.]|uniref:hypothetical protein n=1 Tax=Aquabacterium sp. TaxID=1872578 RepID=UPI0025BAC689|nr:hypothetical protein [Aquabacterium sp.]MBI3380493.1 hypothetical protein [Aquabacterium sp.]